MHRTASEARDSTVPEPLRCSATACLSCIGLAAAEVRWCGMGRDTPPQNIVVPAYTSQDGALGRIRQHACLYTSL
jgi:hypothetical protein